MRALVILAGAIGLAGCAAGQIPTPTSAGLPQPGDVIIAQPGDLPNTQLCAYANDLEAAARAWTDYANSWLGLFGRDPVSLDAFLEAQEDAAKVIEARNLLCQAAPPMPRPAA
jgi:hypothetical protein